jgi:nitrate reductase NapAB chaperone NapD
MDISTVVLWTWPAKSASVHSRLASLPGVQIHACYNGRFVVTIEDVPGRSTADALLKLQDLDGVMNASLVYRYCDDALAEELHK